MVSDATIGVLEALSVVAGVVLAIASLVVGVEVAVASIIVGVLLAVGSVIGSELVVDTAPTVCPLGLPHAPSVSVHTLFTDFAHIGSPLTLS